MKKLVFYLLSLVIPLVIALGAILTFDYYYNRYVSEPRLNEALSIENQYRKPHPTFHHGLKPLFTTDRALWGSRNYSIFTNSLGFKDSEVREVPKATQKRRFVFIGDSFTEGIGLPYGQTFVGIFAASKPEFEILNAGVSSYSPKIYLKKFEWLIKNGYEFTDAVVYIDISDIQDEAFNYTLQPDGNLAEDVKACEWTYHEDYLHQLAQSKLSLEGTSTYSRTRNRIDDFFAKNIKKAKKNFPNSTRALNLLTGQSQQQFKDPLKMIRSMWTFHPDLPCYGEKGIPGGIQESLSAMTKLATLLKKNNVRLSVGVYPWPDQIVFDVVESKQVSIWRDWCASNGCFKFLDHFPSFFALKPGPGQWPRELFLQGDAHFNESGNQLIAEKIIAEFSK